MFVLGNHDFTIGGGNDSLARLISRLYEPHCTSARAWRRRLERTTLPPCLLQNLTNSLPVNSKWERTDREQRPWTAWKIDRIRSDQLVNSFRLRGVHSEPSAVTDASQPVYCRVRLF